MIASPIFFALPHLIVMSVLALAALLMTPLGAATCVILAHRRGLSVWYYGAIGAVYTVVWKVTYSGPLSRTAGELKVTGHDFTSDGLKINTLVIDAYEIGGIQSVEIVRIETTPGNQVYGGGAYSIPVNWIVYPKP